MTPSEDQQHRLDLIALLIQLGELAEREGTSAWDTPSNTLETAMERDALICQVLNLFDLYRDQNTRRANLAKGLADIRGSLKTALGQVIKLEQ